MVSDSVEAWQGVAQASGVALELEWAGAGAATWGDRPRLAQATGNLIANAIEHGGGVVRVHASVCRPVVRIAVSDDGPASRPRCPTSAVVPGAGAAGAGAGWRSRPRWPGRTAAG